MTTKPQTTTWKDGYGRVHAYVPARRDGKPSTLMARRAIFHALYPDETDRAMALDRDGVGEYLIENVQLADEQDNAYFDHWIEYAIKA